MDDEISKDILKVVYSLEFERALTYWKKKDKNLFERIQDRILRILREPNVGKPLRYTLKNRRRIHVGSFVVIYEFHTGELRFVDIDHHDKIYKK